MKLAQITRPSKLRHTINAEIVVDGNQIQEL
jgi:hypothetical protein